MQDLPTAAQLLRAIAQTLTANVVPATSGAVAHEARVAANLCAILGREAELGAEFDAQARALLADVLDGVRDESTDTASPTNTESTAALNDRLYDAIMVAGDMSTDDGDAAQLSTAAAPALEQIVANKLAVAKPGYDTYDFAAERALARRPDQPDA